MNVPILVFGLLLVAFAAFADQIDGDLLIDWEASSDGTVITATILTNSSHGASVTFTTMTQPSSTFVPGAITNATIEEDAAKDIYTPFNVDSTVYDSAGTRGMKITMQANQFIHIDFGSEIDTLSCGFFFLFGGPSVNWSPRDIAAWYDDSGQYQFLQIYDQASGDEIPYFHAHWQPGGSGFGNDVDFDRDTWYWVTMNYAEGGETFRVRFYETIGWTSIGESTGSVTSGPDGADTFVLGCVKYGASSSQYVYFDNLIIDITDGTFPLGPGSGPDAVAPGAYPNWKVY